MTSAETAYLFRHALLRDAAYQLQLPGDRVRLHALAFEIIEQLHGGRAPEPPPLDAIDPPMYEQHSTDSAAMELAEHARQAQSGDGADGQSMSAAERLYLRRAAEYAGRVFQTDASVRNWLQLAELVKGAPRGEALRRAGDLLQLAGNGSIAEELYRKSVVIQHEAGNRRLEGVALSNLANVYFNTGRVEQAERTYDQALRIHRDVGNRRAEGITLGGLAIICVETGRVEQGEGLFAQALKINRDIGNRALEGRALGNLGNVHQLTGRVEQAERTYEQALNIHRDLGDRRSEGVELCNLASIYRRTGRVQQAESFYEHALKLDRDVGNRPAEGTALGNLAAVYLDTGRVEKAELTYEQALKIHRDLGNRRYEGNTQCEYALCLMALRFENEARKQWQDGAAILVQLNDNAQLEQQRQAMREACAKAGVPPIE